MSQLAAICINLHSGTTEGFRFYLFLPKSARDFELQFELQATVVLLGVDGKEVQAALGVKAKVTSTGLPAGSWGGAPVAAGPN